MSRPYARYRDSGVEWLGDVPEHWEVAQLRRRFAVVNGGTPATGIDDYWDGETVWLTPDDLGGNAGCWISEGRRRITKDGVRNSSARVSPVGSVVLSTRAPIGHLAIAAVPAATNQGCRTLVPDLRTDSCFAYYTLFACRSVLQSLGKGSTFMELTPADLAAFAIPMPPPDEQRAIAAFLDRETERVDALVAKKRLLIERLREYRTALITRTVTRGLPPEAARAAGLDPSPRLKPSGVEWLGDVPENWEIARLSEVAALINGYPFDSDLFDPLEGIPLVRIRDLFTLGTEVKWSGDPVSAAEIGNGDILIGMDGDFNVAWWMQGRALLNQRLCCLRALLAHMSQRYLFYCLPFPLKTLNDVTYATTVKHLSSLDVLKFRLPLPPLDEQHAITTFLDLETGRIDVLRDKAETAIERLREYRTALITAAVTGKIDVREAEPVAAPAA